MTTPPGLLARLDQIYAEYSHRITAALALTVAAKVLHIGGRHEDSQYLVDMITETIEITEPTEIHGMFVVALEMLANSALNEIPDEKRDSMLGAAAQTVVDFKEGKFDPPDCDQPEEGLADL